MSDCKHTPGPWEYAATFPPGDFVIYSKTAKGRVDSECKRVAYTYTENENDARLIAAAPDLLAALKAIIHPDNQGIVYFVPSDSYAQKLLADVLGAIAKAEGAP